MKEIENFTFTQGYTAIIGNASVGARVLRNRDMGHPRKASVATVIQIAYNLGGRKVTAFQPSP